MCAGARDAHGVAAATRSPAPSPVDAVVPTTSPGLQPRRVDAADRRRVYPRRRTCRPPPPAGGAESAIAPAVAPVSADQGESHGLRPPGSGVGDFPPRLL